MSCPARHLTSVSKAPLSSSRSRRWGLSHLNESQRGLVAGRLSNLKNGSNQRQTKIQGTPKGGPTQPTDTATESLGVSEKAAAKLLSGRLNHPRHRLDRVPRSRLRHHRVPEIENRPRVLCAALALPMPCLAEPRPAEPYPAAPRHVYLKLIMGERLDNDRIAHGLTQAQQLSHPLDGRPTPTHVRCRGLDPPVEIRPFSTHGQNFMPLE